MDQKQQPTDTILGIRQRHESPRLSFDDGERSYGLEYNGKVLNILGNGQKIMKISTKETETLNLVYSVDQPIVVGDYENMGNKAWKLLESRSFESYPSKLISRCQETVLVGGPCKTSNVPFNPFLNHLEGYENQLPATSSSKSEDSGWISFY